MLHLFLLLIAFSCFLLIAERIEPYTLNIFSYLAIKINVRNTRLNSKIYNIQLNEQRPNYIQNNKGRPL